MSKKILIIIIAVVLLILGMMGAGFFLMWQKMNAMQAAVPVAGEETASVEGEAEAPGLIFPLDTVIVNLADGGGGRYLRVTMELELVAEDGVEEEVTRHLAQIKDALLTILPTRQFDDLNSVEGKNALRDEIITSLNTVLKKELVKKLFFTEFVIQ